MRNRLVSVLAGGIALAIGFVSPAPAQAAEVGWGVSRFGVDVVSGYKNEGIILEWLQGTSTFRVQVVVPAQAGRTARFYTNTFTSADFANRVANCDLDASCDASWVNPWVGGAKLDGSKGAELIFQISGGDEASGYTVMTYRGGKLRTEKAPSRPKGKGWFTRSEVGIEQGYRFFTHKKKRYVDAARFTNSNSSYTRYSGTVIRSVWKSGKWVKTNTFRVHNATFAHAMKYSGFSGVKTVAGYEGD